MEILHELLHHFRFVLIGLNLKSEILRIADELLVFDAAFLQGFPHLKAAEDQQINPDQNRSDADGSFFLISECSHVIASSNRVAFPAACLPARWCWFWPFRFHRGSGQSQDRHGPELISIGR